MNRYRVPVVVFTEVEALDYTDAQYVAEKTIGRGLWDIADHEAEGRDVLHWMDRYGKTQEVTVTGVRSLDWAFTSGKDRRSDQLEVVHVKGREVTGDDD